MRLLCPIEIRALTKMYFTLITLAGRSYPFTLPDSASESCMYPQQP